MYSSYQTPKFWQDYQQPLRNFVRKRVSDQEAAKDLLQDIFYKIYTYCQRYEFSCEKAGITNLRSWIFQTAHNTIADYYRTNQKHLDLDDIPLPACDSDSDLYGRMSEYIEPLLSCLPEMYSTPLAMDLKGTPQKEIAAQLGMGLPAVKSRIQRSRLLVKDLMHTCFYLDTDSKGKIESFEVRPDCHPLQCFLQEKDQKCQHSDQKTL